MPSSPGRVSHSGRHPLQFRLASYRYRICPLRAGDGGEMISLRDPGTLLRFWANTLDKYRA
jgi:hypothetical protein